ncbi:MAG: PAS domain S-box protein, partial [Magnetospirillum sp.]|nr:PAS domain S-box protein [Magnetospirillum sp.]
VALIQLFALIAAGTAIGFSLGRRRVAGTEVRLRDSEARTRAILEGAADGIVTIDEGGIIRSVNPAAKRIFGYDAAEMIGNNVAMLMPEPYRSGHDGYLRNYRSTGRAHIIGIGREVEGQRKDGSTFSMDLSVGESQVHGRRIFAGIVRDITERKQVEERLRASEAHFRALIDGVRDYAIVMVSPDGRLQSWNLGAERLYGWSEDEALGTSVSRFYPLDAIARGDHRLALETARRDGRFEDEGWRLRRDGSRFWAHMILTAIRDGDGPLRGFARVSHDMTEHKRTEDDLKRARDAAEAARAIAERARKQAERANVAKTKFLAAASHDLRQPVQAIFFFTSVLAHKLRTHPAQAVLADLQSSLDGLNILLDSLLDVSKLDAGLVAPKETDFCVSAILDRLAADYTALAADKGLFLRMVPSSAMVRSDPALLLRIVQNLVANAVRYTNSGRILLGCRRRDGRLRIEVWDTGIGIPHERTREIFEEFTQLGNPERDRTQGLGLGLAIVDRLAKLLAHRVDVCSQPGRGSMFAVEVPRAAVYKMAAPPAVGRARRGYEGMCTVVLIDDDPTVLRGLTLVLKGWGYDVLAAASEEEAMVKLAGTRNRPSLILADYRLREGHTGTEAVAHIRDHFHFDIPSIIITGDTAPERLREAEASGLAILHKPIRPPVLREALRESIGNTGT